MRVIVSRHVVTTLAAARAGNASNRLGAVSRPCRQRVSTIGFEVFAVIIIFNRVGARRPPVGRVRAWWWCACAPVETTIERMAE